MDLFNSVKASTYSTNFKTPWTIVEGIEFASKLEKVVSKVGYHVAVAGSVMYAGKSDKDLDLILYPRNANKSNEYDLRNALKNFGGLFIRKAHTYTDETKHVEVWDFNKKRVDLFFLK